MTGAVRLRAWMRLWVALALYAAALSKAHALLLRNGDFASGVQGWGGANIQIVSDAEVGPALDVAQAFAVQSGIHVKGGERYRVDLLMRSIDGAGAFVQASFRGPGVDQGWRGPRSITLPWGKERALAVGAEADAHWQDVSVVIEAPPNASEMLIYLRKRTDHAGSTRFARVSMTPTADAPDLDVSGDPVLNDTLTPRPDAPLPAAQREAILARQMRNTRAPDTVLTIADHGRTSYHIHVGAHADAVTRQAASSLAAYLARMTGANFHVQSNDDVPLDGPLIVVGADNRLASRFCGGRSLTSLGADGFRFCTAGDRLVIAGSTPRGTLYGVYWFLDRVLGVKWLTPDATVVPAHSVLSVSALNEQHEPRFGYREVLNAETADPVFRAHNLLNGESHGPSFFESPAGFDVWDHSWLAKEGEANLWDLLPRAQYETLHPEWYAGGQVAMMNPEVRRTMASNLTSRIEQLPGYQNKWFGIHTMDWGWDMDADSAQFAALHGGKPSAPYLDLVEDVARQVRARLPDARIAFDAYHWGFSPPTDMTVPETLMVFPMTIQVDYSSALNAGRNAQMGADLEGWNRIATNVLIWDHVTNFAGLLQPTPNLYPIAASIRWLATLSHVHGYFAEGSWMTPGAEFASLRAWLIARLLWEPQQDAHALIRTYCDAYFGAASADIVRYIDLEHAAITTSGDFLAEKTPPDMRMFTPAFASQADMLFEHAAGAVAHDPVLSARVAVARMPLDFIILVRRAEYHDTRGAIASWQVDELHRRARLDATLAAAHVERFRQDGDLAELNTLLSIGRRYPATPPADVAGLPPGDWLDLQDLDLIPFSTARMVEDDAASDRGAISIRGDSSEWAVQMKFDRLPPGSRWNLFAELRVKGGGAGSVRVGSYPPMNRFTETPVSMLSQSTYRAIKVPGGPFSFSSDRNAGVYVQSVDMPPNESVLIDRLFAVRVK